MVICGFDPYKRKKYRYTFQSLCREIPGLELGDECTKILLSTKGENDDEVEKPLVDFLHYVEASNTESIREDCDERLLHLHTIVEEIKASAQMGVTYMKWETREREIREDGRQDGIKEGITLGEKKVLLSQIRKKLQKGQTIEQIAEALEEPQERIRSLADEYGLFGEQ